MKSGRVEAYNLINDERINGKPPWEIVEFWAKQTDAAEMHGLTFEGHFYGLGGRNYLNNAGNTAYTNFNNHYEIAVKRYRAGYKEEAYVHLGMAIHYLSDLNAPHHAANEIFARSFHAAYEKWVEQNYHNYLETNIYDNTFDYVKNRTVLVMSNEWSSLARAQIGNANKAKDNSVSEPAKYFDNNWDSTNAWKATEDCYKRSQRAAAGLLYRFISDTERRINSGIY